MHCPAPGFTALSLMSQAGLGHRCPMGPFSGFPLQAALPPPLRRPRNGEEQPLSALKLFFHKPLTEWK